MLTSLWFLLIAVLWVGFFALEGFDFGVGMLHAWIGRDTEERNTVLSTIAPVWDGNEVWLVVAVAGTFAAFPGWYATLYSSTYLLSFIIIAAIIARGVAIVFVEQRRTGRWQRSCRWAVTLGSLVAPFVIGLILGNLLNGLPINAHHNYTGSFWDLFTVYGVWTGVTFVLLCLLHGATFIGLRTTGEVRDRARRFGSTFGWLAAAFVVGYVVWTQVLTNRGVIPSTINIIGIVAVLAAVWLASTERDGWAFGSSAVTMMAVVGSLFIYLYPHVLVSTTSKAYTLTASNTAAADYTLRVMTIVAVILLPVILVYQAWTYYVFRGRVTGRPVSMPTGPSSTGGPTTGPSSTGPSSTGPSSTGPSSTGSSSTCDPTTGSAEPTGAATPT